MKIKIKQEILMDLLEKGAMASLTDEVLANTSNMSVLIQSIRITADKNITIESSTDKIGIKYSIPVNDENGIIVEQEGSVLVPVKEIVKWVKVQNKSKVITLSLSKFSEPENIKVEAPEDMDDKEKEGFVIKKIGNLILASQDNKSSRKWELDSFEPSERQMVDFKEIDKSTKVFNIKGTFFKNSVARVAFSASKKDYERINDGVFFKIDNNSLYLTTTDTRRCAIYKSETNDIFKDVPMLINNEILLSVCKILDDEEDLVVYETEDGDKVRVFITQKNLNIRISAYEKSNLTKFPDISKLLNKKYDFLGKIEKTDLQSDLVTAAIVNNSSALFNFSNDTLAIKAISDDSKYKPSVSKSSVVGLKNNYKSVWCVEHLLELLKTIKSPTIVFSVPDNNKSVKIVGEEDDNFMYFAMTINNPKYENQE